MNHIVAEEQLNYNITPKNIGNIIKEVELQMRESADNLDFESAAVLRDRMLELKNMKSCKSSKR